ncbi:pyridoxal phosphate-dependent aminotransferase [Roseospirillum parvum]|uniref:aspartate transaminase n=1 Tax=Roseospirillum parvum TaxID=83401 RepID=A0A1G7XRA5_9PROT|nr:aminotransferase class I/II-fold pyridoxal phosphate-dependent enzyme [Roseospirillum parvum]SDG86722.1 Aspartate/methionine/tyrosine aminotransferase [Roseospirillum parvum]
MSLKIARRGRIPPFIVMDVMQAAAQREAAGESVLHLEVGQPATGVPAPLLARLAEEGAGQAMGYTVARGLPGLRRRIARHYQETQGVAVDPERIFATAGSSGGFVLAFLAAFEPGDKVGLAAPGYPAYRHILTALGVEPVAIPVGPETRYQPTVEVLENLGARLDGLIVASPANPTGTVIPPAEFEALIGWCEANGVRLISDEIYHGITYDGVRAPTAAGRADDAVVVNSFSKYFCMTGWRLGWLVLPEDMVRPVECLAQNLFISPPTLSQKAGELIFEETDYLEANVKRYAANRKVLLEGLPKAGFGAMAPADGAFYIYTEVAHLTDDSVAFCQRMLAETGVAATPGLDFDGARGHRFVRFSFAGQTADMEQAVARLTDWLPKR